VKRQLRKASAWWACVLRPMVLGLLVGLAACGGATDEAVEAERQLLIVDAPHPLSFEPSSTGRIYTQMGVAETLIDSDTVGTIRPGLAASWTTSEDGREWRFTLRSGARFHDNAPVTPADVAWALNRARGRPGVFNFVDVENIVAEGDEVVVRLRSRSVLLLPVLANFSTQILARTSFDAQNRAVAAVGTGPYKVLSATEQDLTVGLAETWQGPRPQVVRARYLSAGRAETRGSLAESGQGDVVIGLDVATQSRLRGRPNVSVLKAPTPRTIYVKVNAAHPFLNDPRARRALSLAIDRQGIAAGLLQDPERAADQLMPPTLTAWRQAALPPLHTDLAEARRLLAELGWRPGPDGVLTRDGRRFSLTLLCQSVTPELPLIAAAVQEQLGKVGVQIAVRVGSAAETPAAHNDGTLELALANRGFMLVPDPTGTLIQDYATWGGGEFGAMGWRNAGVDQALRELAAGTDPTRTAALRSQLVRTLHEELPVIPIVYAPRTAAVSQRIENAMVDPLERTYGLSQIRWRD
jgi:peptide/nickel transport system substrate-binding protein